MEYVARLFREVSFREGMWNRQWEASGVSYVAAIEASELELVLPGGIQEAQAYPVGAEVWIVGNVIHLPKALVPSSTEE
jgi:hypothetical protein